VEMGRYLCEVRAGQYWRVDNVKSFDEFLERRFPESRRKAYYLMSIHEHLPPQARRDLKEVGWTKGLELAKIARRDRQNFDCATWLHKAREMPKEEFQQEVEKELTGRETEPWEIIYFKLYQSQMPVIERAIETAALMLGSDRSRGYCLEMICAELLAGANLDNGDPETLLFSMRRFFKLLPGRQQGAFLQEMLPKPHERSSTEATAPAPGPGGIPTVMPILARDGWRCQSCGAMERLQVHRREMRSQSGDDSEENLIMLCCRCHELVHCGGGTTRTASEPY